MLFILIQFLSNLSQHVMVEGDLSKLVNITLGLPSVFVQLLFLLYTSEIFSSMENKLIGYADDSSLKAVVPSPGVRVTVAESLNRDLDKVSEYYDLCGMKFNESKTKTTIISISCTMHPQAPLFHQLLAELCCMGLMNMVY